MGYYSQDVDALRALGHDVVVCNRYRDIPWRFDVLVVWWWTFALLPVLFARLAGRVALITGTFNFRFEEQQAGHDYFHRPLHQRALIALAARLASANIFVGRREYEAVPAYFRLRNSCYAPHAVGDDCFAVRGRAEVRTLLLNLAWSSHPNLQRKGVWTILDAAALLQARGRQFDMVLAGKVGDGLPALRQRIGELGLSDSVRAIGEVSQQEKLDLFAQTLLYLQPSFFEGFGLATAEAAAAGCCVITADVGEVRTVMGDECRYVAPGDAAALADAIEELLADPQKAAAISQRVGEHIGAGFSAGAKRQTFETILGAMGVASVPGDDRDCSIGGA